MNAVEPVHPSYVRDQWDHKRSSGEPWEYLLKCTTPGKLDTKVRGKQMVILCGHVRDIQYAILLHYANLSHLAARRYY